MKEKEIIAYLSLSILILFYLTCTNHNKNYPNINTHKSFNPDSLLGSDNSVELIIESEFDNYLLGQNVWVKVDLINNTDSNYYSIEDVAPGCLRFSIIDPDGKSLRSFLTVSTVIWDTLFVIKSGERYQKIISLEHYLYFKDYIIGTYNISCGFYGNTITPYLKSNTIEIEVLSPKDDDKELFDITKRLRAWPVNKDHLIELSNLLNRYSESVYTPQLYTWLITFSNHEDSYNIFESSCDIYFKNYMNFFETSHILEQYALHLKKHRKISNKEMDQIFDDLAHQSKTEKSKIIFDSFFKTNYKEIKER